MSPFKLLLIPLLFCALAGFAGQMPDDRTADGFTAHQSIGPYSTATDQLKIDDGEASLETSSSAGIRLPPAALPVTPPQLAASHPDIPWHSRAPPSRFPR